MAIVALNLKTYSESFQQKCLDLLHAASAQRTPHHLLVCPSLLDSGWMASEFEKRPNLSLFSQSADPNGFGAHTASVPVDALQKIGFEGTLLNHSERKIPHAQIQKVVEASKKIGFKVLVCADSIEEAEKVAAFSPWAVAIEPPELIGSGVSVSKAQPDVVSDGVEAIKGVNSNVLALVGAGVSNREDFRLSRKLGAEGVLLASAFVKAKDPKSWLAEFLS